MKILSIVGPTAVGKTSFALELAAEILKNKNYTGIDLISVDSRQVYQGLEIISGADIPLGFKKNKDKTLTYSFLNNESINLHGVSIIAPTAEWSVAHFQDLAWEVIESARKENHLVIMIGGTGLYHDQLLNLDASLRVKPNDEVRQKAETMELKDLQSWAEEVNPARFKQLNNSDINNPRRLIRLIEIGLATIQPQKSPTLLDMEQVYIGLNQDLAKIEQKIKVRVEERFLGEAIDEVKKLQQKHDDWSLPAFSALGVSEISQYLNNFFSKEDCLEQWTLHELQYARRQLTWWKNRDVSWFKIDDAQWKPTAFTYILNLC
ncbi:MAG: hypothetical protein HN466_02395 [Candidatus Pacebacteria bacterium]|nr:hypothetical protein [Candidatus Paceibacterota bacterium]